MILLSLSGVVLDLPLTLFSVRRYNGIGFYILVSKPSSKPLRLAASHDV